MRAASTVKLALLGILAMANICLLGYFAWQKLVAPAIAPSELNLPAIEVLNDTGKRVWLNSLVGKPAVVQFVDPQVPQQIDSISKFLINFGPSEVQLVLVTQKTEDLRRVLPTLTENVHVVQDNYAELRKTFKVPECCERRFVYDAQGTLFYQDYYYDINLTPRLNSLLKKTLPAASTAIMELLNGPKSDRFASFREETRRSNSGKGVVVLFTSVSSTCPSGELAVLLARYTDKKEIRSLILLPREYSETDLENFRKNFKLSSRVERFDPELAEGWASLVRLYGEPRVNGSVIFINRDELSAVTDLTEIEQRLSQFE